MANALIDVFQKRTTFGGKGYIAGQLPGIVSVDALPAQRPLELRLRGMNRRIVETTYSDPAGGTYLFSDLDPYTKFDIVSKDEPNFVYNDVIVGDIWPWTDYELIFHGIDPPANFAYGFSRTYEITGGVPPYSISVSSHIPVGVTVVLDTGILTIDAPTDPSDFLDLTIEDSNGLSKNIYIAATI